MAVSLSRYLFASAVLFLGSVQADGIDYKTWTTPKGDRIPDFSFCGYHAGNNPLPAIDSTPTVTLQAGSGDQTSAIQDALKQVSSSGGGVVLLGAGKYQLNSGLNIPNGTVLRGAGPDQTILQSDPAAGDAITLGGKADSVPTKVLSNITDSYVPAGVSSFNVTNASKMRAGQYIYVERAVTTEWIAANGMDTLVRDGQKQTWLKPGTLIQQPRAIQSVSGNTVHIDIPLTDSIDSKYMQGRVSSFTLPDVGAEMGIENLSITRSPTCSGRILSGDDCKGNAVVFAPWARDSWARNLNLQGFNGFVVTQTRAWKVTIDSVTMTRDGKTDNGAGYALDVTIEGHQVLVSGCTIKTTVDGAKSFAVGTQSRVPGPNAVVNLNANYADQIVEPHQRWAHGLLVDNSTGPLQFFNRATGGSGHGWPINFGVAWNHKGGNSKNVIEVESPPLGTNMCFGCSNGAIKGNGTIIGSSPLSPQSLYQAQLQDRGKA